MTDKQAALKRAREKKLLEKQKAVEAAIAMLQEKKEPVTFTSVALLAKVSRPFLYNNYKGTIEHLRTSTQHQSAVIDGVTVPSRTVDEHKHIEAALKNKIIRLKEELKHARRDAATLRQQLERERGQSEHWRRLWQKSNEPGRKSND